MGESQYVDDVKLGKIIDKSGFKIGYLAESLGLSREGFLKKRKGEVPFRKLEINELSSILGLSDEERNEIFLQ